jgi:hypothetical protein
MTQMMNILEDYLSFRRIRYLRLDGSSSIAERRDMVGPWRLGLKPRLNALWAASCIPTPTTHPNPTHPPSPRCLPSRPPGRPISSSCCPPAPAGWAST